MSQTTRRLPDTIKHLYTLNYPYVLVYICSLPQPVHIQTVRKANSLSVDVFIPFRAQHRISTKDSSQQGSRTLSSTRPQNLGAVPELPEESSYANQFFFS